MKTRTIPFNYGFHQAYIVVVVLYSRAGFHMLYTVIYGGISFIFIGFFVLLTMVIGRCIWMVAEPLILDLLNSKMLS